MTPARSEAERSYYLYVDGMARLEVEEPSGKVDIEGRITAVDDQRVTLLFDNLTGPLSPLFRAERPGVFSVWDRFGMHRADTQIQTVAENATRATLTVTVPTRYVTTQARRFFRVAVRLELSVERVDGSASPCVERALSYDVSAGGLSFISDTPFAIDDRARVTIALPKEVGRDGGEPSVLDTRVARIERLAESDRLIFGVEFQNVSNQQRDRLVEIMLGLQRIAR